MSRSNVDYCCLYECDYRESSPRKIPLAELARTIVECFTTPPWSETWDLESAAVHLAKFCSAPNMRLATFEKPDRTQAAGNPEPAELGAITGGGRFVASFVLGLPLAEYSGGALLREMGVDPGAFYISEIATRERFRGRELATRGVLRMIRTSAELGCGSVAVRTKEDNGDMIRIFRRLGFHEVGRYAAKTGGVESTRIVFEIDA